MIIHFRLSREAVVFYVPSKEGETYTTCRVTKNIWVTRYRFHKRKMIKKIIRDSLKYGMYKEIGEYNESVVRGTYWVNCE